MDGNFPSWTANDEHGHDVADNTPWGCQALYKTDGISSQNGKVITEGNLGERLDRDFHNACPHHKEPLARMQGIQPEVAPSSSSSSSSSSTRNASMAFSPVCLEILSGTTPDPIKHSSVPVYQDPSKENPRDVPENDIERTESLTNSEYNSVNLAAAQQQDLKEDGPSTWTAVIKEALETSNGMELEQDLFADMCGTPLICDPPTDSRAPEKGISVLKQTLQHGSYRKSRESCKNVRAGKCMDTQTKSCTDNNATPHRHLSIPSHHVKLDTVSAEPSSLYSPTSESKQDDLVHDLQKQSSPTPMPVERSRTWIESEECNLMSKKEESTNSRSYAKCTPREPDILIIAAQKSCTLVRKNENRGAHMLDDTPTYSPSHSSCELSLDTNSTSLMINNTDKDMDNGQIITQNIKNVGEVGEDTTAHYNSKGQSQLAQTVSSNPETELNSVFSFENPSKEGKSDVISGSPQTPAGFLEKETAQVEPYKAHSTHSVEHGHKIDPDRKSSCVNLSSISTPVRLKKRAGRSFKKRTLLKMAKMFSTNQDLSENRTAHSGKFSTDFKKINTEAEKRQSTTTSRSTAIAIRTQKKRLRNGHAEIKEDRRLRKVKRPTLVTDCARSSKMSRHNIGQVFTVSSGPQSNNIPKGSSKNNRLLDCSEDPLKTEIHNDKRGTMCPSGAKDFRSNSSNTLLKTPYDSPRKDADVTESRKRTLWNERSKEKAHSTELNDDAAFELSLQSTINSTGFHSCITSAIDKKVQDEWSRNPLTGVAVKASDKHLKLLEQDVDVKNSLCGSNAISLKSSVQKVDGFTQYCDKDYVTTLNKDARTVADVVKSTKTAKKSISCKFCHRAFRHISAYTVHQRIHTGEKPYRCKLCGKNFAQLSKLKSHRNVHVQFGSLPCPCCGKKFSEKRDLIAHFTTHVKGSEQNNEPGQQDGSKSGIWNVSNNKFPNRCVWKIRDRDKVKSCRTCGKEFCKSSQLVVHEKTHWPVKPYACSICAKSFNWIKALKKHSQMHTGETPFSCSHCGRAFCDLPALRVHQISKLCIRKQSLNGDNCDIEGFLVTHGVDGQVNTPVFFKCQLCKQLYQKWCQYTLHLQTHTKSPLYLCFACGQRYEKASEVNVHCIVCCQVSGEEAACGSSLSEILQTRKDTYLKDSLPTAICPLEASKSNSLSNVGQKNSQTSQTGHLMPESSQFETASNLSETVHLSNDDQLPPSPTPSVMTCASLNKSLECVEMSPSLWRFKCQRCGQRYKRYRSLCLHMQSHAPAFRYVCGHCGHSFERWNKLWLHQRIHRRKGRCYTCSQCNLQFHFFGSYKMHLLNHAEERPYACPLCPQTFVHEEGLHAHQCSFHQPERKLQCDVCSRSFSNLTNLIKHSRLHNGTTSPQCLLCNLSFANNKSLQDHLNAHNNSASHLLPPIPSEPLTFLHKCNRCKSSFSSADLLYAHQICHTRDLKSQVLSSQSHESTSVSLGGTRSSTSRSLLSTLDLDAIPKESLFKYPHPDKLYMPPHLLRKSDSVPIINLDSGSDSLQQEASTNPVSPNSITGLLCSQEYSEADRTHQPQASESQESVQSQNTEAIPEFHTHKLQDKASHNSPTQMVKFVETSVFLEGPTTAVNTTENERQDEVFECVDCSEKLDSLIGLYEHHFLHALGNTNVYRVL